MHLQNYVELWGVSAYNYVLANIVICNAWQHAWRFWIFYNLLPLHLSRAYPEIDIKMAAILTNGIHFNLSLR